MDRRFPAFHHAPAAGRRLRQHGRRRGAAGAGAHVSRRRPLVLQLRRRLSRAGRWVETREVITIDSTGIAVRVTGVSGP